MPLFCCIAFKDGNQIEGYSPEKRIVLLYRLQRQQSNDTVCTNIILELIRVSLSLPLDEDREKT